MDTIRQKYFTIFLGVRIFLLVTGILTSGYIFYDLMVNQTTKNFTGIITGDSCKLTGGDWKPTCGSACGGSTPETKAERVYREESPMSAKVCITSCITEITCVCPKGQYFGSNEEGCIPKTEHKPPKNNNSLFLK